VPKKCREEKPMSRSSVGAAAFAAALLLCAQSLSTPAQAQACSAFGNTPRPHNAMMTRAGYSLVRCKGGSRLADYTDDNGTPRQACFYDHPDASSAHPLPLVVFLQASFAPLDGQLAKTGLVDHRLTADLSGDPQRPGFLLLAPMPRFTTHFYPLPNGFSLGWDVWYRQFAASAREVAGLRYAPNVDFAAIDHFIDRVIRSGRVDGRRIFIVGYSNGASMTVEYVQHRPRIAAAATYSGPNPYAFLDDACPQRPVAVAAADDGELAVTRTDAPVFLLHRDCDVYGSCPNMQAMQEQLIQSGTADARTQMLDRAQQPLQNCDHACGTEVNGSAFNLKARLTGTAGHNEWPDEWTARMLQFLREHPLAP